MIHQPSHGSDPLVHIRRHARGTRLLPLVLLAIASLSLLASPASAQLRNLDDAQFIQGLRERGMRELLRHFLEVNPPKDEVTRLEMMVETHKLDAQEYMQSAETRDKALAAMDGVLQTYRELIKAAPLTHPKQPIWKTDFAQYALQTVLATAHLNAGEFREFGITTAEQDQAFNALVPEAYQMMEDAAVDHFMLIGELPKRDDFEEKFVNNGFWRMFTEEYGNIKLPYYRAWATLWASLLDEPQGNLGQAARLLASVANQPIAPGAQGELLSLRGRVALQAGQLDDAMKFVDELIKLGKQPDSAVGEFDVLIARLARSEALARRKNKKEAVSTLQVARGMEIVKTSPMLLVLTFDREFKITGDANVYVNLFNHPAAAPYKAAIETFVKSRLVKGQTMPAEDLAKAEPVVVLANVDALLGEGGEVQEQASSASSEDERKKLLQQAGAKYTQARDVLDDLLERKNLPKSVIAEALFKLGAVYFQLEDRATAVATWTKLAAEYPDQPVAEGAAINAFVLSRDLWQNNQKHEQAIKLFDQASVVLLEKYPNSRIGNDSVALHWHTRGSFLRELGRHADAVEAFKQFVDLNPGHTLISDARYQVLLSQHERLNTVEPDKRAEAAEAVVAAAKQAVAALEAAAAEADGERVGNLKYQAGDAVLRQAEVLSAPLEQHAKARTLLSDFDERFGQFPDLIRAKREMVISLLVAMGQAGEARNEVEKLIKQFPDQGGALIAGVLGAVNKQIEDRRLLNQSSEALELASVGVDLASFLLNWAKQQPDNAAPEKLMPFQLMLAKQLVMAERYDDALQIYQTLYATPAGEKNFNVIFGQAQTLFRMERYNDALPLVNTILRLATDKQGEPKWWETWMMRVVILDHKSEAAARGANGEAPNPEKAKDYSRDVFTTIQKLQLVDKDLGGPAFKDEFIRLQNKHFPM